jgi:hypothetical protein
LVPVTRTPCRSRNSVASRPKPQRAFHVVGSAHIAVRLVAEVELHGVVEAPFERHLVDGHRRLAVIHRGMEMIGRIEVRAVVGRDRDLLHRGTGAVGKLVAPHAEHSHEIVRAGLVIEIGDGGQHIGRVGRDPGFQRDRNIDDATRHTFSNVVGLRTQPDAFGSFSPNS